MKYREKQPILKQEVRSGSSVAFSKEQQLLTLVSFLAITVFIAFKTGNDVSDTLESRTYSATSEGGKTVIYEHKDREYSSDYGPEEEMCPSCLNTGWMKWGNFFGKSFWTDKCSFCGRIAEPGTEPWGD